MAVYLVTSNEIFDRERYVAEYTKKGGAAVAQYGGRFLVEGGAPEIVEGDWCPQRMAVVEFPDRESALRFYNSPEYQEARKARLSLAKFNMVIVETPK